MNDLTLFKFEKTEIRTITDEHGEPWFVLRDVLEAMGSKTTTTNALESIKQGLGEGYSNEIPLQTKGGLQTVVIVSEPAVTHLVSRSNTETGRKLNRFIHAEVLPQIRKTGRYETGTGHLLESSSTMALQLTPIAMEAAKAFGFRDTQAALSADRAIQAITGVSALDLMGQRELLAAEQDALLTVSDIADRLGWKPREVNPRLTLAGLQDEHRDHKGRLYYEVTELGRGFGVYLDTNKKHGDGTPVRQLKWRASIVDFLRQQYPAQEINA